MSIKTGTHRRKLCFELRMGLELLNDLIVTKSDELVFGFFTSNFNYVRVNLLRFLPGLVISMDVLFQFYKMFPVEIFNFVPINLSLRISSNEIIFGYNNVESIKREIIENEFINLSVHFIDDFLRIYVNYEQIAEFSLDMSEIPDVLQECVFLRPLPGNATQCLLKRFAVFTSLSDKISKNNSEKNIIIDYKPHRKSLLKNNFFVYDFISFKNVFQNFEGLQYLLFLLFQSDKTYEIIEILIKALKDPQIEFDFIKINGFEILAQFLLNSFCFEQPPCDRKSPSASAPGAAG